MEGAQVIIEFGAWQLRPTANGLNWELYHRHTMQSGKDAGAWLVRTDEQRRACPYWEARG